MISPTSKGIRSDSEGDGRYGASRGSRRHNGVDFECDKGQDILAPHDMVIVRESFPKAGSPMTGIAWKNGKSTGRLWYFRPTASLIGKAVKEGDVIGVAQSVSEDYGLPNMKDHVHYRVNK